MIVFWKDISTMDLIEGCKFATGYMAGTGIYISLVEVQSRRCSVAPIYTKLNIGTPNLNLERKKVS